MGLIQTLTSLCSLQLDFGRNSDWLLEQCHKIWLAVRINRSWKCLFQYGVVVFMDHPLILLSSFIALWSYDRKIILCLDMCHWNSENSGGCSYLLRICFICGTNVSVLQSWIPLQVADHEQGAFWFTNKRVQIKILSTLKLVSFESLAGNDFSERGSQAETHCKRNLNRQLWSIRWKISHPCSRNFYRFYHKS